FFFFSLYLLTLYLKKDKKIYQLHFSLIFLILAILTQPILIFWSPLYLSIVYFKKKKVFKKTIIYLAIYGVLSMTLNIFFIATILHMPVPDTFRHMYLSKGGEFAEIPF